MGETEQWWEKKLATYLAEAGLRVTSQRRAIARAFFESTGHPNIDELYTRIRARHPRIGQATVYRTLKLLVDSGLAESSRFGDGTTRYEVASDDEHHDHLICVTCGYILEFRNDEIERLQEVIAKANRFRMADHKMVIYGECLDEDCTRRTSSRRIATDVRRT